MSFGVKLWHDGQYLLDDEQGPPPILPLQFLKNHIASHDVEINDVPAIATLAVRVG